MNKKYLQLIVSAALSEDIGAGDVTTNNLIPANAQIKAQFVFKSSGIVCGLDIAEFVLKFLSKNIVFKKLVKDGAAVSKGTVVATIQGSARAILTGERVALNFLTHLSAIATRTRAFVNQVKPYSSKILDTRKTTPLLRTLERYAVRVGGGFNHRFNLEDMAMIKDNHRMMLKEVNLIEAVNQIKKKASVGLVLEVDTFLEFKEALQSKADVILLDNMHPKVIRKAVMLRNRLKSQCLLEASGGINLKNVKSYAKTGVDRISIGSLTSVIEPIDISLDFKQ